MEAKLSSINPENFVTVEASIGLAANAILERFKNRLPPWKLKEMQQVAESSANERDYLNTAICLGDRYSIEIYVDFQHGCSDRELRVNPKTGDIYKVYPGALVRVSWPSYGSVTTTDAVVVLKFYSEVASFAQELQVILDRPTIVLWMTKAQKEEADQKQRTSRRMQAVKVLVASNSAGLRISSAARNVVVDPKTHEKPSELDGEYDIEHSGKTFQVKVQTINGVPGESKTIASITRLS